MILLQASHIVKSYGTLTILSDVSLTVQSGERVGLVGVNGAGKSTLLKIMAGKMSCDAGTIIKAKGITTGYLAQDGGLDSKKTIHDELLSVFQPLMEMEQQLRALEVQISNMVNHQDCYDQLLHKYDQLSEIFKTRGGYTYQATVNSVMHGLDLNTLGYDTPIENLSGGQKTLIALAKLLLQTPDVLMLDEPTNYLDINTLNWLEQYLKSYSGALLIVSHDRYLLDTLVNVIYELEQHQATRYQGNYTQYLEFKAKRLEQQLKTYQKQQQEVARMEEFIQRNIVRASTSKRAQSRRRMLEKMELVDKPQTEVKKAQFAFNIQVQSGKDVLKIRDLTIGYQDDIIATNLNFFIERGESIALVGPNGVGKSTLLKTILGKITPLAGDIHYGTNVQIAYFDQEQANLQGKKQILHEVWDDFPYFEERVIRTVLGNFLFSGDDVLKTVAGLSGGEKARLALAKLMLKQANFLILDEPTNHLDIYSRQVLENALIDYPGTILFVSHDRYFVNRIATRVIELNHNGVVSYLGDYDYYIAKKQQLEPQESNNEIVSDSKEQKDKQNYLKSKEIKRIERQRQRKIEQLQNFVEQQEQQVKQLEEKLHQPEIYQDYIKCQQVNDELNTAKAKLDQYLTEWLILEEESDFQ